jgi:hypothetical protein
MVRLPPLNLIIADARQGSHRACSFVVPRIGLSRSDLRIDSRRCDPCDRLCACKAMADVLASYCQHSGVTERTSVRSAWFRYQLWKFCYSWILLPVSQAEKGLCLVVEGESYMLTAGENADRHQYNYIIAAALDAGAAFGTVSVWLFATIPGAKLHWWGTEGYMNSTLQCASRAARLNLFSIGLCRYVCAIYPAGRGVFRS